MAFPVSFHLVNKGTSSLLCAFQKWLYRHCAIFLIKPAQLCDTGIIHEFFRKATKLSYWHAVSKPWFGSSLRYRPKRTDIYWTVGCFHSFLFSILLFYSTARKVSLVQFVQVTATCSEVVTKLLKNFKETLLLGLARMSQIYPPQGARFEKSPLIYMKISRALDATGQTRLFAAGIRFEWARSTVNRACVLNPSIIINYYETERRR